MIRADKVPEECVYCPAYDLSGIDKDAYRRAEEITLENIKKTRGTDLVALKIK